MQRQSLLFIAAAALAVLPAAGCGHDDTAAAPPALSRAPAGGSLSGAPAPTMTNAQANGAGLGTRNQSGGAVPASGTTGR